MKKFKQIQESLPAVSVGTGAVAGMPTASPAEQAPVMITKMLRRKTFAGNPVFVVNSESFHRARYGKKKFEHYSSYVGDDEVGQQIREYARDNPDHPIIIEDELTGAMVYLRYGKR